MSTNHDCGCHAEKCENITGNALDLDLNRCDSEVRADIKVGKSKECCVRVWGQIKDCDGNPVKDALIKLLKSYYFHGKIEFEGVAHTTTDCMGFYQFDVCIKDEHEKSNYRILVGKPNSGPERVLHGKFVCDPCND